MDLADLNDESQLITESKEKAFRRDGHICIRGLLTPAEIASYRPTLEQTVTDGVYEKRPLKQRDTYGRAFLQVHNLWQRNEICRRFVHAKRFAHAAAALLGVPSVRLYHDQALFKEAGGGYTPWHQDQTYWPLEKNSALTIWIPLEDIEESTGSMHFVTGSHQLGDLNAGTISDKSHSKIEEWIQTNSKEVTTYGGMKAGDVTFHAGFTLHSAGRNKGNSTRPVMTVIYVAEGTQILNPTPEQKFDLQFWLGGKSPGETIGSKQNPVLYP